MRVHRTKANHSAFDLSRTPHGSNVLAMDKLEELVCKLEPPKSAAIAGKAPARGVAQQPSSSAFYRAKIAGLTSYRTEISKAPARRNGQALTRRLRLDSGPGGAKRRSPTAPKSTLSITASLAPTRAGRNDRLGSKLQNGVVDGVGGLFQIRFGYGEADVEFAGRF